MEKLEKIYYPGIDVLRAFAVLSVVLYHLNAGLMSSGYVGVDVFFVISGFVVSLSMASARTNSLTSFMALFYSKRVIRIAPALVVCLLITTIASCLFIPRAWLSATNWMTGLAAFFGMSNFILAHTANDYFSPRTEFNPFTHTWSLAVEEQFYLVFPLLAYHLTRYESGAVNRRRAAWALVGLSLLSIVCCAWWSPSKPTLAFYLIPARFWELGVGVGLFISREIWLPRVRAFQESTARTLAYIFLTGLVASMFITKESAFPFPWAMLPVVCTAGLLTLIFARQESMLPGVLSGPVFVWVGKISYSLYL